MATSDVKVTAGAGKNVATYSLTEDAETKEIQRVVINTSAGVEVSDLATQTTLALVKTDVDKIPALGQALAASSVPVTLTALEEGLVGSLTETAPATDTASSGLNGRLQRIAQRITSLIALLPTALGAGGGLKIDGSGTALPVSGTVTATTPLPAAAALADAAANPTTPMIGANLSAWNGASWDRLRVANITKDLATVTITSITTVWTPTSGKKFRLMGGSISVSAAGSVLFEDNSGGNTVVRTPILLTNVPYNFVVNGGQGFLSAAANNVLKATLSVTGTVTGNLYGTEE